MRFRGFQLHRDSVFFFLLGFQHVVETGGFAPKDFD